MASIEIPINVAVEGLTDEVVVRRILQHVGITNVTPRGNRGKAYLLDRLDNFNQAAQFANWLVVVDLDNDAQCAPTFITEILSSPSEGMLFRVSVREVESWIMADREQLAAYLKVAAANFPQNPDLEDDPKRTLINVIRNKCRNKKLVQDMVPRSNSGRPVGPGYSSRITEFMQYWRPEEAARNSDSLERCIIALQNWKLIGA